MEVYNIKTTRQDPSYINDSKETLLCSRDTLLEISALLHCYI